jgi:hypothetical protein
LVDDPAGRYAGHIPGQSLFLNECVTVVDKQIESQYDESVSRKRSSHVRINSLKFENDSINT